MAEAGSLRPRKTQLTRGSDHSGSVEELPNTAAVAIQQQAKSATNGPHTTNERNYTLVDIKSAQSSTNGAANKRPNTRSNERKSRQAAVGAKSNVSGSAQNAQSSVEASSQSRKPEGPKLSKSSALNDAQSSIQASEAESGRRDGSAVAGMINELSSNVPLTAAGEGGEWRPQQIYEAAQHPIQIGQGILASSGEPKTKVGSQPVSGAKGPAMKHQQYSDKPNSNLRKRNQTGSNHRVNEPRSAKQNKTGSDHKVGGVDMPEILGTPNLGQNLSHARVTSYQSNPGSSAGSAFPPPLPGTLTGAEYRDSGYVNQIIAQAQQIDGNSNPHSAFTSSTFNSINTSMAAVQARAMPNPPNTANPGPPDYQSAGFGFMQQNGQGQTTLPSTFQFTTPMQPGQQVQQNAFSAGTFHPQLNPQQQQVLGQQPQQQPPTVHFIANKQKFYGISPERAQQLLFNTGAGGVATSTAFVTQPPSATGDKRPFTAQQLSWMTASGQTPVSNMNAQQQQQNTQVFTKRQSAAQQKAHQQQAMMAALYLGGSTAEKKDRDHFSSGKPQQQNLIYTDLGQSVGNVQGPNAIAGSKKLSSRLAGILGAYSHPMAYSQSVPRRTQTQGGIIHSSHHNSKIQREQEQLYEEVIRLKQLANVQREENVKLKTKIRVMETDMARKERTLEDFVQQSQYFAQANAKSHAQNVLGAVGVVGPGGSGQQSSQLAPVAQSASRYQQETFLVISLKKQIKELKYDVQKRDEEILMQKRNVRHTKFYEMETEIKLYKEELARLRHMLENVFINQSHISEQPQNIVTPNTRPNNSAFEVQQNQQLRGTELKNSFSEPPTTNMNSQPLSELGVMGNTVGFNDTNQFNDNNRKQLNKQNELTSMSEQVEVMSQTQTVFGGPSLMMGQPPQIYSTNSSTGQGETDVKENCKTEDKKLSIPGTTTTSQPPKSISGLNRPSRTSQQQEKDKREMELKHNELKHALTKAQQENSSVLEKVRAQFKELTRVKKTLKEREKDVQRLKEQVSMQQSTGMSQKEDENEKKAKQLEVKICNKEKQVKKLEEEVRVKDEELQKVRVDLEKSIEAKAKQMEKLSKQNISVKKSLEDVINELKKELEQTKKAAHSLEQTRTAPPARIHTPQDERNELKINHSDFPSTKSSQEKAMRVKHLQFQTLDELSLLAEQICYLAKTDRVDCAEIIMQQIDPSISTPNPDCFKFKGLREAISLELMELLSLVSVQQFAYMLPKCRSSSLSKDDREELLIALRGHVTQKKLKEIVEGEDGKMYESVNFAVLKKILDFSDPQTCEADMKADTAYRLVQILYFDRFLEGEAMYRLGRLACDLVELSSPTRKRAESSILELEKEGSLGEKSIVLKDELTHPVAEEVKRETSINSLNQTKEEPSLQTKDSASASKSPIPMDRRRSSAEDERMLDVAEGCFIRLSELLMDAGRTVRGIFTKFSQPEIFPDNTVLELLSPMAFLAGVREAGFLDLQEVEAACLMKVLAKPELDNHIILNELVLIMENFGVHDNLDDDEEDDFVPDSDEEGDKKLEDGENTDNDKTYTESELPKMTTTDESRPGDHPHQMNGDRRDRVKVCRRENIDAKGIKILTKLARFLLKQFVHPREFFGQCIKKTPIATKKKTVKIDTLQFKDFYLRMKIASIRKKLTPNDSLNGELCVDRKRHNDVIHVKSMVKILEEIAEKEQEELMKEEEERRKKLQEEGKKVDESTFSNSLGSDEPATPKSEESSKKLKEGEVPKDGADYNDKSSRNHGVSKSLGDEDRGRITKARKTDKNLNSNDYRSQEAPESLRFGSSGRAEPAPASASRACKSGVGPNMVLGTIEEDKAETQTSNYQDGMSEREDSKLFGSNHLRGSNILAESDCMEESSDYQVMGKSGQLSNTQSKGSSPGPGCRSVKLNNSSGKSEKLLCDQATAEVNQINEASEFNEEDNQRKSDMNDKTEF